MVHATLAFRLDPALGGDDAIEVQGNKTVERDRRDVEIVEITSLDRPFTYDQAGFQYIHHKTATTDFDNDELVSSSYYQETCDLVKKVTGASVTHCFQHLLRATKLENQDPASNTKQRMGPALALHVDYNYDHTAEYIRTLPERPPDWERLSQSRWAIFSVWRPLNKVTRDALCVGDKRTIPDGDLVNGTTDMSGPGRKQILGLFWVNYNPAQRYYYKHGMGPEDVLLIKVYDTEIDGRARCTPHTAFRTEHDYGEARTSIETRCIAVWENESSA